MRPYLEKNPSQKRTGGVAQGEDPKFKSQDHQKKKKKKKSHLPFQFSKEMVSKPFMLLLLNVPKTHEGQASSPALDSHVRFLCATFTCLFEKSQT
jgi:hypothetical protein